MQLDLKQTIAAVGTGLAPASRAIVRISGSATAAILECILAARTDEQAWLKQRLLKATRATAATLPCLIGWGNRSLPTRVYFWPDHRSFTGEPCAEIHLLGCLPVVEALVELIVAQGAKPADRGEFTLRSFLAGKIDLTQAEAVLGVIEADAPSDLDWALGQLAGNLSNPVRVLRSHLIELLAHLEAGLDFVEEDIEFISEDRLRSELELIAGQLASLSAKLESRGTRVRAEQIVLMGLPNAGKSTLFNALLGCERAIVNAQPGTTRDALIAPLELEQLRIELVDTAGVEELSEQSPRGLAQGVLQDRLERAAGVLFCVDLSNPPENKWLRAQLDALRARGLPVCLVGTKADLPADRARQGEEFTTGGSTQPPSGFASQPSDQSHMLRVGAGADDDLRKVRHSLRELLAARSSEGHSTAMHRAMIRSKTSIDAATQSLELALEVLRNGDGEEIVAAELRCAVGDLSAVIGEVHSEDILSEIFSRFCIGK